MPKRQRWQRVNRIITARNLCLVRATQGQRQWRASGITPRQPKRHSRRSHPQQRRRLSATRRSHRFPSRRHRDNKLAKCFVHHIGTHIPHVLIRIQQNLQSRRHSEPIRYYRVARISDSTSASRYTIREGHSHRPSQQRRRILGRAHFFLRTEPGWPRTRLQRLPGAKDRLHEV